MCRPALARTACKDLCGQAADEIDDDGIQLLSDIEGIFADVPGEFISSTQLVRELKECDESPWRDTELTAYKLSLLLKPFGVKPRHGPGKTARGYWAHRLHRRIQPVWVSRPSRPSRNEL
ncbi:MAG TPA: DUF3631 domain-containing protein [Mycobacterium sp.]